MSTPQSMSMAQPPIGALLPDEGREELAKGLLLVRASNMNLVRFQLAMERRDRAVALQTVDELMAIDRRLRDFLRDMPAPGGAFDGLVREVEEQRASLAKEKLTLVAGKAGPRVKDDQPEWSPPAEERAVADEILELVVEAVPEERSRSYVWIALALLALVACGLALGLWGTGPGGELLAFLPS